MADLESRLARLEHEADIRKLKARYLNACDAKDVERMRACFTEEATLDFPPVGKFGLDGLIDVFTQMAVSTPITDVHQGHNAEIDIAEDGKTAKAKWNLSYFNYDPRESTIRLLANFYADEYALTDEGWRITFSQSQPRVIVDGKLDAGSVSANWVPVD